MVKDAKGQEIINIGEGETLIVCATPAVLSTAKNDIQIDQLEIKEEEGG